MSAMTIEECVSKYWPVGCEAFAVETLPNSKWFRWYKKGVAEQVAILLDDDNRPWIVDERTAWLPIIACVAAMHWNNEAQKRPHGPGCTREQFKDFGAAMEAYRAWSELAKGV